MEFYQKTNEKDIEKTFEQIDKNKEHILSHLKTSSFETTKIVKKITEEWENEFYINTFIRKKVF